MDLSLLVHTCDNYQKFWGGMLFSLDFNWDFNNVPVYWASEEVSIHDNNFSCRELPYKPNPKINQILTGKTDKNGFSTRMRIALEQILTKWVIYIQEDMWLLSKLDNKVLSELLLFANLTNADSIKINAKELTKEEKYHLLHMQWAGLIDPSVDVVANLSNASALLHSIFQWWWVGFYRVNNKKLI